MDSVAYVFIDQVTHALPLDSISALTSLNHQLWTAISKTHLAKRHDNELLLMFRTVDDSEKSQVLVRDISRGVLCFDFRTLDNFQKQDLKYQRFTKLTLTDTAFYNRLPILNYNFSYEQAKTLLESPYATFSDLEIKSFSDKGLDVLKDLWKVPVKTLTQRILGGSKTLDSIESWHLENNQKLEMIYCQNLSRLKQIHAKWNASSKATNLTINGYLYGDWRWIEELGFRVEQKKGGELVFEKTHPNKNAALAVVGFVF
ncbi:hypothetical protein L596_010073 [Steinernema carpocapsae]|uniref:F-box associated domain-containing protein n=1 Tax=Steinernema carpocapsae TaxID=34508 RepID=A0A4U5PHR8_STECR|nr:hypothetical protein L596_010073 [Steinernema carpocapsae]